MRQSPSKIGFGVEATMGVRESLVILKWKESEEIERKQRKKKGALETNEEEEVESEKKMKGLKI